MKHRRSRIHLLIMFVLMLSLPTLAYAGLLCRSDPAVKLSNGVQINMGADIYAAQSQVIVVNYELHVPVGVSMSKPVRTPGWSTTQETFALIADQQPNQYRVVTTVRATIPNVAFTAYSTVVYQGRIIYNTSGTSAAAATTSFSR